MRATGPWSQGTYSTADMYPLTRRELLIGGTAALASSALGCRIGGDGEVFDLCIVGSGFAGTFLGLRAVENGLRTVMIEAGRGLAPSFGFTNSGSVSYPINQTRHIGLGGGSNLWAGVVMRLWPEDFRMRSEFAIQTDWPITYEELRPYYCEAEQLLATSGFPPVEDAEPPRACPYPHRPDYGYTSPDVRIEGVAPAFFPVAVSRRGNQPVRLIDRELIQFRESPYGTILEDRQAMRFMTLDGRTVDHVEVRGPNGAVSRIRARKFVTAAGVIESARLLLLSRSRLFPDGLGNSRGLVGRYFNMHPWFRTVIQGEGGLPRGWFRTYSLSDTYRKEGFNACWFDLVVRNGKHEWRIAPEIEPRFENRVSLSSETMDEFGTMLPNLHMSYSRRDRRTFRRSKSAIVSSTRGEAAHFTQHWLGHPYGTCRMGSDEASGVVDSNNRVFGIDNLYVSGASTFPTPGTANPTNTVVAMTLRLADHLIRGAAQ